MGGLTVQGADSAALRMTWCGMGERRGHGANPVSGLCPVMAVVVQGDKAGTGSGGEDDWRRQRNRRRCSKAPACLRAVTRPGVA